MRYESLTMNISEFQQKIAEAGKPVVVDFWAPWCMPCRMTKPILERLAVEYNSQLEFMAINADDSREVLYHFQVIGIPTVMTLRNGSVMGRLTGAQNEAGYRALFGSLADGKEVKIPISPFDRLLRFGAGISFVIVGFSTGSWIAVGVGGLLAFLGMYDRCPVWRALTGLLQRK